MRRLLFCLFFMSSFTHIYAVVTYNPATGTYTVDQYGNKQSSSTEKFQKIKKYIDFVDVKKESHKQTKRRKVWC